MVRGLVDRLVVNGTEQGTVATVRHRLSRPAYLLAGESTPDVVPATGTAARFALSLEDECLHLSGWMDQAGVDTMQRALREVGSRARVVVDLRDVTRLPSAAVQALHRVCRDAADQGQDLVLVAPPGTAAQHVLELVRLPYVTTPMG
jgi:anti-anti-sigma regulatory factor